MLPIKTPLRVGPATSPNGRADRGSSPLNRAGWGAGVASILPAYSNEMVSAPSGHHPSRANAPNAPSEPPGEPRDKIYALRFRTKLCRNFEEKGSCPYESRCMFAHGCGQLRTTEMNITDGVLSTQAILDFKAKTQVAEDEKGSSRRAGNVGRPPARRPSQEDESSARVGVAAVDRPSPPSAQAAGLQQCYTPNIMPLVLDAPNSPARSVSSDRQRSRSTDSSEFQETALPPPNWSPQGAQRRQEDVDSLIFGDDISNLSVASSTDVGSTSKSFRWNPYRWTPIVAQETALDNS